LKFDIENSILAGKKNTRRAPAKRIKDRSQALKLHLEGRSNVDIARILEVTEATIRNDIKAVETDWQAATISYQTIEPAKMPIC
jgi:DNA-binding NarL/FixJ family response regulator